MLFDWFTVLAQLINFLVLVWLLKRFLYKPVLQAIAEREKRIAGQLQAAAAQEAEAHRVQTLYMSMNEALGRDREMLLKKAVTEAEAQKRQLMEEGRTEYAQLRSRWEQALGREREALLEDIRTKAGEEVIALAGRMLRDLAEAPLEECMVHVFARHIRALPADDIKRLKRAMMADGSHLIVRTAFDLPQTGKTELQDAVRETFSTTAACLFEKRPDLISGVEVTAGGLRISWNVSDYLSTLAKDAGI